MYENVGIADLRTFFQGSLAIHKGKPRKVISIGENRAFKLLDLLTQKTVIDEEGIKHINPPLLRLGMVNIEGEVVFMSRLPVRKMHIGLNSQNTTVQALRQEEYPQGFPALYKKALEFTSPGIAETMLGKFPSFREALKQTREFGGACAFDRQFAVNKYGDIYYKTNVVGCIKKSYSSVKKIEFKHGYESLIYLIRNDDENDCADSREGE